MENSLEVKITQFLVGIRVDFLFLFSFPKLKNSRLLVELASLCLERRNTRTLTSMFFSYRKCRHNSSRRIRSHLSLKRLDRSTFCF